jgi:hypothetical protein
VGSPEEFYARENCLDFLLYVLKATLDCWVKVGYGYKAVDQKTDDGGLDWVEPIEMEKMKLRLLGNLAAIFHVLDRGRDRKRASVFSAIQKPRSGSQGFLHGKGDTRGHWERWEGI